jgi:pyruvate,water dikinase
MAGSVLDGLRALWQWARGRGASSRPTEVDGSFKEKYQAFLQLLESNTELLRIIAEMEDVLEQGRSFGPGVPRTWASRTVFHALRMLRSFETLAGRPEPELHRRLLSLQESMEALAQAMTGPPSGPWILAVEEIHDFPASLVGGKAATMGALVRAGFSVPRGFVVTTAACAAVLQQSESWSEIQHWLLTVDPHVPTTVRQASEALKQVVQTVAFPPELGEQMAQAMEALARQCGIELEHLRVAVRSSAEGEDGDYSFAGQYHTVLGVGVDGIEEAYREVLASLFTPEAIVYRAALGMDSVAMAVLVQEMIPARAAGVLFTRDPRSGGSPYLLLEAALGLGVAVVDGLVVPDRWVLERTDADVVVTEVQPGDKAFTVVPVPGGIKHCPLPETQRRSLCLDTATVLALGRLGEALERFGGGPQDVEWVVRDNGDIVIVQSRPLGCVPQAQEEDFVLQAPVLVSGGEPAYAGIGAGPVFVVHDAHDLDVFPQGAVLVASHSSPEYLFALPKAAAVVTEFGSVTGHMASLCREFHVPSLVGVPGALAALRPGEEVTVDARTRRVYAGRLEAMVAGGRAAEAGPRRRGSAYAMARSLYDLVVPLRLVDPKSPQFAPQGCHTIHDIMRYLHEHSYAEMFRLSDLVADHQGATLRLNAPTGLDLHIIDLGGALAPKAGQEGWVRLEDVLSRPFAALLQGLVLGEAALRQPRPVHVGGLLSVLREQALGGARPGEDRFGEKSYAIVSDKYLNFSSRVGYHYGVLDCYCGNTVNKNYISFVFKGGAADDVKRSRRARAIAAILARLHFRVETVADQSFARFHKASAEVIADRLVHVGRLLQFTRQADMLMVNEACVDAMVESFLRGDAYFQCPV